MGDADGWDLSNDRPGGPAAGEPAAGPPAAWKQPAPGRPAPEQAPYGQAPYGQPGWGAPPPQGQPYPPGAQQYPPPGPYPPGYPPGYPPPQPTGTSGRAIAVLCCGIGSLLVLFTCFVGFVPAVVALCLAPGAKREIAQSQGAITGAGMVRTGKICAWITIVLTVLVIVAVVALVAWGSSSWSDVGPFEINTF